MRMEKNKGKGQEFQPTVSVAKMPVLRREGTPFCMKMWELAQLGLSTKTKMSNKKR